MGTHKKFFLFFFFWFNLQKCWLTWNTNQNCLQGFYSISKPCASKDGWERLYFCWKQILEIPKLKISICSAKAFFVFITTSIDYFFVVCFSIVTKSTFFVCFICSSVRQYEAQPVKSQFVTSPNLLSSQRWLRELQNDIHSFIFDSNERTLKESVTRVSIMSYHANGKVIVDDWQRDRVSLFGLVGVGSNVQRPSVHHYWLALLNLLQELDYVPTLVSCSTSQKLKLHYIRLIMQPHVTK